MESNKKFQVKILEEGRLTKTESEEITGGINTCPNKYAPTCGGTYFITTPCYSHTFCSRDKIGDIGFVDCPDGPDGAFTTCVSTYSVKE